MSRSKCTAQSSINFAMLAFIRGSTPLMMWFAMMNLHSVGLVVAIKCGITLLLFVLSSLWYLCRDEDSKLIIMKNITSRETYWKICVIGLLQSAAPYILAIYALKTLPPTLLGVFMVTTPWWSALFERLPFIKGTKLSGTVKVGMIFGAIGITMMLGPVIKESITCAKIENDMINSTTMAITNSSSTTSIPLTTNAVEITDAQLYDSCRTPGELGLGALYLLLAPVLWGVVAVFWKFNRKDIHMLVSSMGQNLVGCVCGILFYFIAEHVSDFQVLEHFSSTNTQMYVGVLFLGVLTGWLATLLVQHLYVSIGSKTTNQVLTTIPFIVFVEDCMFVRDVITVYPWVVALEVLGVLLVTVGVFVSNMALTKHPHSKRKAASGDLSSRLLDNQDYDESDDDETTSDFFTSTVGGENDYTNYEPPPVVITNEEEELNSGHSEEEEVKTSGESKT